MITQYSDKYREWSWVEGETKPTAGVRPGDEGKEMNASGCKRYKWDATNATWVEVIPKVQLDGSSVTLTAGDIEIGAVEIKNATDDTRATVGANGLYVDVRNIQAGTNTIGKVGIVNTSATPVNVLTEETFTGRIGEVQATPTSNTVLARLRDLLTGISLASGDNNIGNVDVASMVSHAVYSQGWKDSAGAYGDLQLDSLNNLLVNLNTALPAGTNQVGKVGYTLKKISATFNRPTEATPTTYAIGDAICDSTATPTLFQFDLATIGAVAGQSVEVRKVAVVSSAKQSILPLVNVYLSNTTFTATNDNAALDIADATMESGGSWFQCDVQNYTASNSRVANVSINEPMILAAADTKLYGTMQAANAYVPVSAEKFTIILWVALL